MFALAGRKLRSRLVSKTFPKIMELFKSELTFKYLNMKTSQIKENSFQENQTNFLVSYSSH